MTEGRGPMVLDKLFLDRDKAIAYFNHKPGVMGRPPSVMSFEGKVVTGWIDAKYGDWELRELEVIE